MAEETWWSRGVDWVKRKYQIAPTHQDALADQRSLEHELIPGQLSVRIMKLWPKSGRKEFPCWAFVSRGLRCHGHPEVALFLEQLEGEQGYPRESLRLFEVIDRIIAGGQHFGVGDVTELPRSPLPGFHLAYIPPPTVSTNPLPPSTLCAILVTSEELAAIRDFGFTRVMARLGEAAGSFPCPFWSDRSRSGLSFGDTRQHSILSKAARIRARGGRVHLDGNQVFFRLPRGTGAALARSLREAPTGQLVGFLTELDPDGDGCRVWKPGQTELATIAPDYSAGARISACFLLVAHDVKHLGIVAMEDGFVLNLSSNEKGSFHDALAGEDRITIASRGNEPAFVMEWYDPQGPARTGLDVYEVFGTYPNNDARRLLDAFVANHIDFTLDPSAMGLRDLTTAHAEHGDSYGNSVGITIGVQIDDWERAMILRQRVLKILV